MTTIFRAAALAASLVLGPAQAQAASVQAAPVLEMRLLNIKPHDPGRYTQGLLIRDGVWFESSGGFGVSAFIREFFGSAGGSVNGGSVNDASVNDASAGGHMKTLLWRPPPDCFAEGAAWAEGEIYLLTWRNRRGFVLDPETLAVKREFDYTGEGWGLAWDGRRLWRSDGSSRLQPHRPGDFAPAGRPLTVRDGGAEVSLLNELEWDPATGLMLANVYGLDKVAAIDLRSGAVRFWLEAAPLRVMSVRRGLPSPASLDTALNGLARDGQSLWLTGKLWPLLFQIAWPPAGWEQAGPASPKP